MNADFWSKPMEHRTCKISVRHDGSICEMSGDVVVAIESSEGSRMTGDERICNRTPASGFPFWWSWFFRSFGGNRDRTNYVQ